MRKQLEKELFETLKAIEGNGTFITSGVNKFIHPALHIKNIGELGFPLNALQIKGLIEVAKKAPFGKGLETITDPTVRSAWEIDADEMEFKSKDWEKFLKKLIKDVGEGLGIEHKKIIPSLYKMLIYEKGDFFLPHKDSEKEKGMFGTLVVGLPSDHSGGELIVRFGGQEETVDFSFAASTYKIPHVAFFADCEHEIKPVTDGHRVALVFNLLQAKGKRKFSPPEFTKQVESMTDQLLELSKIPNDQPMVFLLGHQYTPTNFSIDQLKHHDRPRTEALLMAAEKAGYFAKLGLVTCYQMGQLEGVGYGYDGYGGRRGRYYAEPDLSKGTMGEIYEVYTKIDKWSEDGLPDFGEISVDEDDLIRDIELAEGEPIAKEAEGFTGNAGMTLEYWYHYGAVILWHKSHHVDVLLDKPIPVQLNWLEFYLKNWNNKELDSQLNVKLLLKNLKNVDWEERKNSDLDLSAISTALIKLKDEDFIKINGTGFLAVNFNKIIAKNWVELFQHYPPELFTPTFLKAGDTEEPEICLHLLNILDRLDAMKNEAFRPFIQQHINKLPEYLKKIKLHQLQDENYYYRRTNLRSRKENIYLIIDRILHLSKYASDKKWVEKMMEQITAKLPRNYVNEILTPILSSQNYQGKPLNESIYQTAVQDLIERTEKEPTPPKTWKRAVPSSKNYYQNEWEILRPFLESPTQQVFDYARNQSIRSQMESAIRNVTIDLKTETIRRGSPHTLRITKTQAAFEKKLKDWKKDVSILKKMKQLK